MSRIALVVVCCVVLACAVALAEEKPAPEAVKLPPGWSTKWAGTLICPRCVGMAYQENVGTCTECKALTSSGAFKLCPACALKAQKCSRCLAAFPAKPTAGLKLELNWVKPELKITDPRMSVRDATAIPVWVTVTNTTKEPITANDFLEMGGSLKSCTTLIFVVRAGKDEKVLWNVSPLNQYFRAPGPIKFAPGATTFEADLAKCYSAVGKLGGGKYTVKAAVGWLESNELVLTVGGGAIDKPLHVDPETDAELKRKIEAEQELKRRIEMEQQLKEKEAEKAER